MKTRVRTAFRIALFAVLILTRLAAHAQDSAAEYKVKAAFLFHFAQLVDWPADGADGSSRSIDLCVFDGDPHAQELQSTLADKTVGDRVLHVRSLRQGQDPQSCSIVFFSRDEGRRRGALLSSLRNQPVLTVGESEDFLKSGGMIRFHLEGGRVRFDVNLAASEAARLRISSRLLLLASQVTRGSSAEHGGR